MSLCFFLADLRSNHNYLRQLNDFGAHCKKHLLQPVDGGNQSFHPACHLGTLTLNGYNNIKHTGREEKSG